jgi:hypothetical protein
MKPKKTVLEKQETTRRKNRSHWSSHKEQIIRKRSLQKAKITATQLLAFHGADASGSQMDHLLDGLNIHERERDESHNDEESEDHLHVDELSVDIEESDRSDNGEGDDESEETETATNDESLHELEKETLQEFLESMSSEAADREHDQLVNEGI